MSIKQISVFLENKPGTLKKMTGVLADHQIDMRALSIAETKDFGIARIIVDDVLAAVGVLKDADFVASLTSVLAVAVPDEPGGLDKMLQIFADAKVNIEYMYAFITVSKQFAYVVLRVEDNAAAEKILTEHGITLVNEEDMAQL